MQTIAIASAFKVLSSDNLIYGPIDLDMLVQWVRERRVDRETWVLVEPENEWVAAGSLEPLNSEFDLLDAIPEVDTVSQSDLAEVTVAELREFERFKPYSNEELEMMVGFCELVEAAPGEVIIRKGDLSDSMFLLLSGRVQARLRVGGHNTPLGEMEPGELFGEVAMLSQTPRTADVVTELPSRLLRLTSDRFRDLHENHPALAAKMLFNLSRQLATRLSQRNNEMQKELASAFVWR
jgi:CRP-like cAMP-binding protein